MTKEHKRAEFSDKLARAKFSANLYGIEIKGSFPVSVNSTTQRPYMRIDTPATLAGEYSTYDKLTINGQVVTTIQVALVADIVRDGLPIWQNLSTAQVGVMLGKSQSSVCQMCESGTIPNTRKIGSQWEINRKDFVRWYMPKLFEPELFDKE